MTNRKKKTGVKLQNWLNQFSDRVDYRRFQHGITLYHEQRIREFQIFPNHFDCKVIGNQSAYHVNGYFRLSDGIPIDYDVACSCPDDTDICKHSVCATMYFILNRLSQHGTDTDSEETDAREKMIEEPLRELTAKIEESKDTLLTLHDKKESRLIRNHSFIQNVNERIMKVMNELRERKS